MTSIKQNAQQILNLLAPHIHTTLNIKRPLILGISGLQGSGKSTYASALVSLLTTSLNLRAITVSLDDFYRMHSELVALRDRNPPNALFRTRGQPGTHDELLARDFFTSLKRASEPDAEVKVPVFDKSQFNGEGDRVPESEWHVVRGPIDVVVFEGWCVGFQAIGEAEVRRKQEASQASPVSKTNTLPSHRVEDLIEMDSNLQRYCENFMGPEFFDAFVHLDTDDLGNVYEWRLEQEHALIKARGTGMEDEQVEAFIKGYMPGYELYLERLRRGLFENESERGEKVHVRVLLGRGRDIQDARKI